MAFLASSGDAELRAARADLDALSERERRAGITEETDDFLAANQRVVDAEQSASTLARFLR